MDAAREGHRARLRERFDKAGFEGFADHEVVELLLTLCIPRRDVKAQAHALLQRFGSIKGVLDAPAEALKNFPGLGTVAPTALRVIRETANLYLRQKAEGQRVNLQEYNAIEAFWRAQLGGLRHEVFEIALLDSHYCLLHNGVERLAEGIVNRSIVYPRKIIETALRHSATAIVVAHNHPSGIPTPSEADRRLTQDLATITRLLGLELVDHFIITPSSSTSFKRLGLL